MSGEERKQKPGSFPFAAPPQRSVDPTDPGKVVPAPDERIPMAMDRSHADEDPRVGTYIGPYRVERKLSKGGMGHVYLAQDEALRRRVALKVMDKGLLADEDALKRFEREARAAAAVDHPYIAKIFLVGLGDDGEPFLAMEYIAGGSLLQTIRSRTPVSFSQAALWMEQVVSALGAAKRVNIIHRDIKPANIMLTESGEAKVVDFGLAKIFFEDSYMTVEGMVLGTPSYMAPEQGQGRVVDHRADIYSVGATFYHLITGRAPFVGDSPVQIMMKHVTAPLVPMRSINPNVPLEFDDVIALCMRKEVDERFQDYEALLGEIKRLRLLCNTRETGSVVGASGDSSAAGSGSVSFPPPPRTRGQVGGEPPPKPTTATVRNSPPAAEGGGGVEANGLTLGRVVMTVGAIVLAGLALITLVFRGGKAADDAGTNAPPSGKSPLGIIIQRATADGEGAGPNPDLLAYRRTLKILESLRNGLAKAETIDQALPASLKDIATEQFVIVNFETDEQGNPLDGWGTPIGYIRSQKRIFSTGMDRAPHTGDDISTLVSDEQIAIAAVYMALEKEAE